MKSWGLLGALFAGFVVCSLAANVSDGAPEKGIIEPRYTFRGPFLQGGSTGLSDLYVLGGAAILTDSFVRLTPAIKDRRGWMWNKAPVTMKNWEVEFEFKVAGGRPPGADGFAFWYVQTPETTGPVYGNADRWMGLGVIFDTYDNDRRSNNPYVLAMLNDGTISYDHNNDGLTHQLGGCIARYRSLTNMARALITYKDNTLDVSVDLDGNGAFSACLHADNIHLPTGFYFGMSAATGALSDNHDVYSWTVRNLDGIASTAANSRQLGSSPSSTSSSSSAAPTAANPLLQPSHATPDAPSQPSVATASLPTFEKATRPQPARETEALLDHDYEQVKTNPSFVEKALDPLNPPAPLTDSQKIDQLVAMTRGLHRDVYLVSEMVKTLYSLHRTSLDHIAIDKDVDALSAYMQQLQRALSAAHDADAKGDIIRMRDFLQDRIVASNRDMVSRLEEIGRQLVTVHGTIETTSSTQEMIRKSMQANQKQVEQQIKASSKWGFLLWFVVFQVIFAVAFIWWKKNRDEEQRKLP